MSDVPNILHESDVREVIRDEMGEAFSENAAAPDDVDASVVLNGTYSHTEVEQAINNVAGTLNTVLQILRDNGLAAEPS